MSPLCQSAESSGDESGRLDRNARQTSPFTAGKDSAADGAAQCRYKVGTPIPLVTLESTMSVPASPRSGNNPDKKDRRPELADRLIEQIEAGTVSWQGPWEVGDVHMLLPDTSVMYTLMYII